jgi:hypothetical protein
MRADELERFGKEEVKRGKMRWLALTGSPANFTMIPFMI